MKRAGTHAWYVRWSTRERDFMSPLVRDSTTASFSSVGSRCHVERVVVADIVANEGYWTANGTVQKKRMGGVCYIQEQSDVRDLNSRGCRDSSQGLRWSSISSSMHLDPPSISPPSLLTKRPEKKIIRLGFRFHSSVYSWSPNSLAVNTCEHPPRPLLTNGTPSSGKRPP